MAFALQECIVVGRTWFVKMWTSSYETSQSFMPSLTQFTFQQVHKAGHAIHAAMEEKSIGYWIGIYTIISLMTCIVGSSRYYLVFHASLRASNTLFQDLTKTILRAPLRWLDTVPMGRVLNRFSKDFETIDSHLANDVSNMVYNSLALTGVVVAGYVALNRHFCLAC